MSASEARGRRLSRRRLLVGLAVLAVGGYLVPRGPGGDGGRVVVAKREDLVETVEVEGELEAVRSTEIGVPPVTFVEFKIAFLVPEGATVKKGEPVLGFDTQSLQRQLVEMQAELQEAVKKVEQKEIELGLKLLEIENQAAQAEADLGKARLKAEVPPEVQQRIELEKARLDEKGRERDLQNLRAEERATRFLAESELASLRSQRDRGRGRVDELQAAIGKMTVLAPQDGIVVYRTDWQDQKKKVGDTMWFGEKVLAIPDLTEMRGLGFVDEADGGPVAEGQAVTLRLEARADLDIRGRVRRVARTVKQRSWRTPGKVFRVDVDLGKTDPTLMRPAMRFRGEIETARTPGLLLVPKDAVYLRGSGPVVWLRRAWGWSEQPVRLGRSSRRQVEIREGVAAGDRLSAVDLAAPGGAPRVAEGAR